jgi:hypothetical protein
MNQLNALSNRVEYYALEHRIEKARRQKAVIIPRGTARHLAQIIAWPHEFVAFADDNPRTFWVEAEQPLDRRRNFDGGGRIIGRTMR